MAQQERNINPKLVALQNEKDKTALQQKIKVLEKGTAEDLDLLIQYYDNDSTNKAAVTKMLFKKYPDSQQARMVRMTSFLNVKGGPEEIEKSLLSMIKEFPNVNLDMEKTLVALAYAEIPDSAKAMSFIDSMEDPVYKVAAISMMVDIIASVNSSMALNIATKELERVKMIKEQTNLSTLKIDPTTIYNEYINRYGKLLFNAGKDEEAFKYIAEAYKSMKEKDEELVEYYALLSSSLEGNYTEAFPVLVKAVKEGKKDKKYIDQLRIGYEKLNPGKDADAFIASLQQGLTEQIKSNLEKMMINEAAPDFYLMDVNGKKVTLADFKGKTIVLDFWATWCGPCVASFPAMQIAVNHYINDPDVKFLFIHTWENAPEPLKDAQQFLGKRNYKFDLYMDTKDPVTKRPPAITAFKAGGIPAKFIIDRNGMIRFKLEGFEGTTEAAAEEVIQMVEMARSNQLVSWKIDTVKIGPLTYEIKIKAIIKESWHIYSQDASKAGSAMPTQIVFEENSNVELIGATKEKGIGQENGETISNYSKEVTFTQTLKLKSEERTNLNFSIKYMVCTDQMCQPPTSKKFSVTVE